MRAVVLLLFAAVVALPESVGVQPATPPRVTKTIAITIDDLPFVHHGGDGYVPAAQRATKKILAALRAHRAVAIGLLNENKLEAPTADERAARLALLQQWIDAGHRLGNHTYSHPDANALTIDAYVADIDKGERVTRAMMRRTLPVYFRHPMTHTGDTAEKKAGIARALAERGYVIAPHTIENADFIFDAAYAVADEAERLLLGLAYLDHTIAATAFAEAKARELFGRGDVPQILLIHANAINADTLPGLVGGLSNRGYRFITLDDAMADRAYHTPDAYVGSHGPTWLFRWSRTLAPTSDFRADPEPPAWVTAAAEAARRP
ncbi:MAG: polysaccharide deacetylase family protein [Vicinamibacteraceae bacterium]